MLTIPQPVWHVIHLCFPACLHTPKLSPVSVHIRCLLAGCSERLASNKVVVVPSRPHDVWGGVPLTSCSACTPNVFIVPSATCSSSVFLHTTCGVNHFSIKAATYLLFHLQTLKTTSIAVFGAWGSVLSKEERLDTRYAFKTPA